LIQVRDEETGEQMTDDQIRSEALTFLIAGHETTATALTWTCVVLATHPDVQQRARAEAVRVLGDRDPTLADLSRLAYTRMVIEESMRLYPPIWAITRQVVGEDEIGGFRIPAKSMIVLSQYVTHRHPDFWPDPDRFDPERFNPEHTAHRPKGAYFPFLAGPHQCIGMEFAMAEMRLIIAMLLRRFELEPANGAAIRARASLALQPAVPVRIRLHPA
jgi:cytochrome P450